MQVSDLLDQHFRHFNARETVEAARAWRRHLSGGGKMLISIAGAMSTGELGPLLARMIQEDKVHAICSTGANLEEDLFNLVANPDYRRVSAYRDLTPQAELELRDSGFNRVTDTCIPESAIHPLAERLNMLYRQAAEAGESLFPWQYVYRLIDDGTVAEQAKLPLDQSWVVAAREKDLPIYTPGWEDSTLGNMFTAAVMRGDVPRFDVVRPGTMQMEHLVRWYQRESSEHSIGFFQIGGGIAGDFAICAVPLIIQDLKQDCPFWGYFAQISDSVTSYGSYSGAVPNEKITWFKLSPETPRFMINSDASIVAPLIFSYVLGE